MPLLHPSHELFDEPPLPLYAIFPTFHTPNRAFHTFHELCDALAALSFYEHLDDFSRPLRLYTIFHTI